MPRGGSRPGAGRPKKTAPTTPAADAPPATGGKYKRRAPPAVDSEGFKTEGAPDGWPFGKDRPPPPPTPAPAPDVSGLMPLDYLLSVMRDEQVPSSMRWLWTASSSH